MIEIKEQPPEGKNETLETDETEPSRRQSEKFPSDGEQELELDKQFENSLTSPHLRMRLRNNNGNEDNEAEQEKKQDSTDGQHNTSTEPTQATNLANMLLPIH